MQAYLYRRGDGNEGNFPRAVILLKPTDCPYAALRALVVNDYIPGHRVRKHVIRTIEVDGEPEYGLHATVYEGPDGEQAFDAAYITAQLEPLSDEDRDYYEARDYRYQPHPLRKYLDRGALELYRKHAKRAFAFI